jgi:hypothetical protein
MLKLRNLMNNKTNNNNASAAADKTAQTGEGNAPRVSILLSSGRTVAHERMSNGAQNAYVIGSATGAMTESEWSEYCNVIQSQEGAR